MGRAFCTLESAAQETSCPAPGWKVIATHPSSLVSIFLSSSPHTSSYSPAHSSHCNHVTGGAPERCPLLLSLEAEGIRVIILLTWILSNVSDLPWCYPEPRLPDSGLMCLLASIREIVLLWSDKTQRTLNGQFILWSRRTKTNSHLKGRGMLCNVGCKNPKADFDTD